MARGSVVIRCLQSGSNHEAKKQLRLPSAVVQTAPENYLRDTEEKHSIREQHPEISHTCGTSRDHSAASSRVEQRRDVWGIIWRSPAQTLGQGKNLKHAFSEVLRVR
jgi:hypothetical protein